MRYGDLPKDLGIFQKVSFANARDFHDIRINEIMQYQYYPIKMKGDHGEWFEERLKQFSSIEKP